MICQNCGAILEDGAKFCQNCGASQPERTAAPVNPTPTPNYVNNYYMQSQQLPPQYQPLSPWAYFGLSLLYAIPVIGFIFLIVFSISDSNINRRNFTRSFWCALLVAVILAIVIAVIAAVTGVSVNRMLRSYY